jgi:hypothetical protein
MKRFDDSRPALMYGFYLLRPLQTVEEAPGWAKVLAPLGGLLQVVIADGILLQVLALYVIAGMADFVIGAMIAHRAHEYSPDRARAGVLGKVAAVVMVLILRAFEGILPQLDPRLNSHGFFASAAAFVLLLQELRSLNAHREILTGKPIPLLGALFDRLDHLAEALMNRGAQGRAHDDP